VDSEVDSELPSMTGAGGVGRTNEGISARSNRGRIELAGGSIAGDVERLVGGGADGEVGVTGAKLGMAGRILGLVVGSSVPLIVKLRNRAGIEEETVPEGRLGIDGGAEAGGPALGGNASGFAVGGGSSCRSLSCSELDSRGEGGLFIVIGGGGRAASGIDGVGSLLLSGARGGVGSLLLSGARGGGGGGRFAALAAFAAAAELGPTLTLLPTS